MWRARKVLRRRTFREELGEPVLDCFVAVLLQVLHKRRTPGTDSVRVLAVCLRLAEDVRRGIFQVQRAKRFHTGYTSVVNRHQDLSSGALNKSANRTARFERFDECPVVSGHVSAHLHEIGAKYVLRMTDPEHRI